MIDREEDLDALLSQAPYIEDGDFTDALVRRLPRRRPGMRARATILLACAIASCGAVAAVPGARRFLADVGVGLSGGAAAGGPGFAVIAVLVALLICGAVAAATSDA